GGGGGRGGGSGGDVSKQGSRLDERAGEGVHVVRPVVQIKRRAGGRCHVQPPHQRLCAVVTGADTDPVLVENGRDVVRVNIPVRERHDTRAVAPRLRTVHRHALDLRESLDRGGREGLLVLGDPLG